MPYDLSLVGQPSTAADFEYRWKDVVLYALGIGARRDELPYLYEKHGPMVYPSFAVVAPFAPVFEQVRRAGGELATVVHHAQKVRLHGVLPPQGRIRTVATIRGMWDLKRFVTVIVDAHSVDATTGAPLFDTTWSLVFRGGGGFGGGGIKS